MPLGLSIPSGIGVDLLTPLVDDGPVFFTPFNGVDASCVGGAGVEFASEFISVGATALTSGTSSIIGVGDEAAGGLSTLGRNFFSVVGGRASTIILLCFFDDLSVRPFVVGAVTIVTVVVDMDESYGSTVYVF